LEKLGVTVEVLVGVTEEVEVEVSVPEKLAVTVEL
jgi:hypothetical protein